MRVVVGQGSCGIATGAKKTAAELEKQIAAKGLDVKVDITGCVGTCYLEPIVDVYDDNGEMTRYVKVQPDKVAEIVESHLVNHKVCQEYAITPEDEQFLDKQQRVVLRNCGKINPENIDEYLAVDGYKAIEKVLKTMKPEEVIEEIKISGLRGRGGAGFPTWFKWNAAKSSPGKEKYLVCNADEGDPGAFMDRSVLEGDPHVVLEAMAIAGYVFNSHEGYIYIRGEYREIQKLFQAAIDNAVKANYLGKNIMGSDFSFNVHIVSGAGAYICGENSGLLNSIEAKTGRPRVKPPHLAEVGLYSMPTLVNNVESFASVPQIVNMGGKAFQELGVEDSGGTKLICLSGNVNNRGTFEVPIGGVTLRDLIFDPEFGGGIPDSKELKFYHLGGQSGPIGFPL